MHSGFTYVRGHSDSYLVFFEAIVYYHVSIFAITEARRWKSGYSEVNEVVPGLQRCASAFQPLRYNDF